MVHAIRVHGPWTRPVDTDSVYRALGLRSNERVARWTCRSQKVRLIDKCRPTVKVTLLIARIQSRQQRGATGGVKSLICMAVLRSRCGHSILPPWFLLLSFFLTFLRGRRFVVYHTSTHDVALVRIYNAGLKYAASGSPKIHDSKNRQKFAICAPSHKFVGLYLRN